MIVPIIATLVVVLVVAFVAYMVGYHAGYEHGLKKFGWCGSCRSWHGNDRDCQQLPENA
jgi:hypothetical protein